MKKIVISSRSCTWTLENTDVSAIRNWKIRDDKTEETTDRAEQVLCYTIGGPPKADQEIPAKHMGRNQRCWVWIFVQSSWRSQKEH